MDIKIAREVAARIWCDQEVSAIEMDVELAEEIAQLLASRLTKRARESARDWKICGYCSEMVDMNVHSHGQPSA